MAGSTNISGNAEKYNSRGSLFIKNQMKLVAEDVAILADDSSPGFFVAQRPGLQNTIRLTAAEVFLIEGMRKPYSDVVLMAKCKARFSEGVTGKDFQKLLGELDAAGMLVEENSEDPQEVSAAPDRDVAEDQSEVIDGIDSTSFRNHLSLFKPQKLFDIILKYFGVFRHLGILIPFAFLLALVGLYNNLDLFMADISDVESHVTYLDRTLFTLFTINLATQLYRGLTARYFGFETPSFGMILVFGLLPRFNIRIIMPDESTRRARLWTLGAPIYIRFITVPLGIFLWLSTKGQGTSLPVIGVSLAMLSLVSFLFVGNPLLGGAGYRFISEYFETPNLRKKAFTRLKGLFSKQPPAVLQYVDRSPAVLVYGLSSVMFSLIFVGAMGFLAACRLKANYQGMGVAIFLLVIIYLFSRFGYSRLLNSWQRVRAKSVVGKTQMIKSESGPNRKRFSAIFKPRYIMLIVLMGACLIPYQYESGGEAEVFPVGSAEIYSEYNQLVDEVYFDGGETLSKGTVIAELVNEQQKLDVEKTKNEIKKTNEELGVLLSTPSPEQVAVAKEELQKAEVQLSFSQEDLKLIEGLYKKKSVTLDAYQNARQQVELDRQSVKLGVANLDYVKNKVNKHEIEAIKTELSILHDQLAYHVQELERTKLKMPIDGKIITMNLKSLKNSYLKAGEIFAKVEDASKVRVEIKIPEGDIGEVSPGDKVKLRLQTYPKSTLQCNVRNVHPSIRQDDSGGYSYIISDCFIDNESGELKTGMTGFAKIEGREMLAIAAFSRALVRFVKVEVWSWVP